MKGDNLNLQEEVELKCNHFFKRHWQWSEYGVRIHMCNRCLKLLFHIINRTEHWAAIDALQDHQS